MTHNLDLHNGLFIGEAKFAFATSNLDSQHDLYICDRSLGSGDFLLRKTSRRYSRESPSACGSLMYQIMVGKETGFIPTLLNL
jgi:hypothetical protein